MKLLLATFKHETNTFFPVLTLVAVPLTAERRSASGLGTSDYIEQDFRALRKPGYPLDAEAPQQPISRQKPWKR